MGQRLFVYAMLAMVCPGGHAKSFETSYVHLELPNDWSCERIEADWACRPTDKELIHTASLVFSAKDVAAEDTFSALAAQLKTPRTISTSSGKGTLTSKVNWSRAVDLAGHRWVEALHTNGEIEGYFTYYLATVTPRLAVLLNFSFQQSQAQKFQPIMEEIRRTVALKNSALNPAPSEGPPQPLAVQPTPSPIVPTAIPEASKSMKPNVYSVITGILGAAIALYFAMRRKRS